MKKINIPLSGITRNTDDAISADGQCMELINARVKNGSIVPIGKPILKKQFPSGAKPIYIHRNANYENIICASGAAGESGAKSISFTTFGGNVIKVFHTVTTKEMLVNHIGNILCITADNGINYFFFDGANYSSLGNKIPLPFVQFTTTLNSPKTDEGSYADINPAIPYTGTGTYINLGESAESVSNCIYGSITKLYDTVRKGGRFTFPVLVRYAYRLFDGSYIMQSNPILIQSGLKLFTDTSATVPVVGISSYSAHEWDRNLTGIRFSPVCTSYQINMKVYYEDANIEKWKDIIVGIDVFVSPQISTFNFNGKLDKVKDMGNYGITMSLDYIDESATIQKIENERLFYKAYTCEMKSGTYVIPEVYDIAGVETLPDDEFSHNTFIPDATCVYNNRLHIAGINTELFKGHYISQFQYCSDRSNSIMIASKSISRGYMEVHIKTESGIAKVYHEFSFLTDFYGIAPYLSYPDTRAFKMIISLSETTGNTYRKEFNLKPSSSLNLSYAEIGLYSIELSSFQSSSTPPVSENTREYSPNKLKVSELSNPFYFPAKQTYTAGQGKIMAMCSNTAAISQGQFGQYPLYIFTSEGIYSAQVGSGNVVYSAISPLSRDVCNNRNGVTPIDNAVVFTTEAGLMLLSGSVSTKISDQIEGYLPSSLYDTSVLMKILSIPKLQPSTTEFQYYAEGSNVGYNYAEREIIVSNKNYPYSYLYNLTSGQWSKLSLRVDDYLNSYPECLAVVEDRAAFGVYDVHNSHRTVNDIAIITRPVKLGSLTHKRILQSALRGVIKPSLSNLHFRGETVQFRGDAVNIFSSSGFYVLGSNDSEVFTFLSGTEKINDIRDLITKMNKTKAYKYFIFALVGGVRTDVAINFIEVMADEAFDNRLR